MEELKRLRKERGLSHLQLQKISGVHKVTQIQIEQGRQSPKLETLEKLAEALGIEVADFFPKSEPPLPFDRPAGQGEEYPDPWFRASVKRNIEQNLEERMASPAADFEHRIEELGHAWAQQVSKMRQHREEILQRRLDDANSEDERKRAASEFQAAYLHTFVLIEEARRRFPAVLVDELQAAVAAWRERVLEFHTSPGRRVSSGELENLEARLMAAPLAKQ